MALYIFYSHIYWLFLHFIPKLNYNDDLDKT